MPEYSYKCPEGHVYSKMGSMTNVAESFTCPVCGRNGTRYFGNAPAIHYKGTGWGGHAPNISPEEAALGVNDKGQSTTPGDAIGQQAYM